MNNIGRDMLDKKGCGSICIYTLNGYANYGNRLQLFALSKILSRYTNELAVYWPKSIKWQVLEFIKYRTLFKKKYSREIKLLEFTKRYIPKNVRKANYDVSVVGSDQVWNPEFIKDCPYLLNVPDSGRKLSYAASIGMEKLSNGQKKMLRNGLKQYSAISVREESAKELLRPLTNREVNVVLDPTLLLDSAEYEKLEKRPENINKSDKYVLCYILGNHDNKVAVENYAKNNGCKIVYFSDKTDSDFGIEEFLYLIHHAQLICTDSFHACVFSFLFGRPFVVFRRSGKLDYMYTRVQNLIEIFELSGCEYNGRKIEASDPTKMYAHSKEILKIKRSQSLEFLKRALFNSWSEKSDG